MNRNDLCHEVRQRLARLPEPYASHYGVIPAPPPTSGVSVLPVAERHTRAIEALARIETLVEEGTDSYLVSRILARQEAVSSSAVEGTHSTLDEILSVEESDSVEGSGEMSVAAKQVKNYAAALDALIPLARKHGYSIFTDDLISLLHKKVMMGDPSYKDVPGEIRHRVVCIGGLDISRSIWNPPPPLDVRRCLAETINYIQCDEMSRHHQSFLTRIAVSHSHFESVHPFSDGNGRVGRLLIPLMMAAEGRAPLYLSPYIETHKNEYYAALKASQQRLEWHEIIGFVSDAVICAASEIMTTRRALNNLKLIWKQRRRFRLGSAALSALSLLSDYPVLTVSRLASMLDVTFRAANIAIEQLCDASILRERTGHSRNRIFAADEALNIMNRPFGERPLLPDR